VSARLRITLASNTVSITWIVPLVVAMSSRDERWRRNHDLLPWPLDFGPTGRSVFFALGEIDDSAAFTSPANHVIVRSK